MREYVKPHLCDGCFWAVFGLCPSHRQPYPQAATTPRAHKRRAASASAGQYTVKLIASTDTYSATKVKTNYIAVTPPYHAVITYTYDGLYRLTKADSTGAPPYTFEYAYDAVGNRTTQTATIASPQVTNYDYDEANRLITVNTLPGTGDQEYAWDDNGNLVSDSEKTYIYNQANQLTTIEDDGLSIIYHYNGDGARLEQIVNEAPITYVLDLAAPLVQVLVAFTICCSRTPSPL